MSKDPHFLLFFLMLWKNGDKCAMIIRMDSGYDVDTFKHSYWFTGKTPDCDTSMALTQCPHLAGARARSDFAKLLFGGHQK